MLPALAALAILLPLGWFWQQSLVPDEYAMTAMGYADPGGGPAPTHQHATGIDIRTLAAPSDQPPDVAVTLVARRERYATPAGAVAGYTLNHTSPGPEIRARQGQLVQVTLVNESVPDGVTLHWHGVDVPNAEDGVAGVTQDAVRPGGRYVYRFVARDAGTYWYHSHQLADDQVRLGLYGALVVTPATGTPAALDRVALVHTVNGRRTVDDQPGGTAVPAAPGTTARIRLVNTDAGPIRAWVTGAAYTVLAVDGRDVHGPTPVRDVAVLVTAGGRIDIGLTVPAGGARVDVGAGTAVLLGEGPPAAAPEPADDVDLLGYGTPAPVGFDPARADRHFAYRIGRSPGFLDGKPGLWWTVNGHLYPDVPMFMVNTGDVVQMTISNSSGQVHPMHLHGHHAVVLSRNGQRAGGSPWWVDSLDVRNGDTYVIAFVADNPGIWVDHCHNLAHARQGLLAHLAYYGYTTPFRVGGPPGNVPE